MSEQLKSNQKEHEPYTCFRCGHPLIWSNDFMASEVGKCDEDTPLDDDWVVSYWQCSHCGDKYEIEECPPDEREGYKYYEEE